MNQESPEYVVRNYDAVDRQVSEISRREAIISRKLEIANQKNLATNFILFAAAGIWNIVLLYSKYFKSILAVFYVGSLQTFKQARVMQKNENSKFPHGLKGTHGT